MECKTIRSGLIDVCFTVSVSISAASICHACLICVHVEVKIYCNISDHFYFIAYIIFYNITYFKLLFNIRIDSKHINFKVKL